MKQSRNKMSCLHFSFYTIPLLCSPPNQSSVMQQNSTWLSFQVVKHLYKVCTFHRPKNCVDIPKKFVCSTIPHGSALCVRQWKLRKSKVPKRKDLFHAHFGTKKVESFFNWWKTTNILQKIFGQWNKVTDLGIFGQKTRKAGQRNFKFGT